ncbi:outer membrane protein assembly factor BamB family protein [Nocardiopsis lucentensis]|uniref:outer membrane protein assembly factor BamB family protein n=1 Tax=Nocardiopsis lucentensis TaxID=53441 RepID=UPI00034B244B|nr:PQQ-binding-like beta-propeller repeat protein [Nocardiopsis lucentensis]
MPHRIATLASGDEIRAYAFTAPPAEDGAVVEPAARYPAVETAREHAAAPDLSRAAYHTREELVCVDRGGAVLWQRSLEVESADGPLLTGSGTCAFSADGTTLWVYRRGPLVPMRRGLSAETDRLLDRNPHMRQGTDRLLALGAADGAVLAEADLKSSGHGAELRPHPDGKHVLVGVAEGQDGGRTFRARLNGDTLGLHEYDALFSFLRDLSPNGRVFSLSDEEGSVEFRSFPDGELIRELDVGAFGYDEEEFETLFVGTYLADFVDDGTAVVSVHGERVVREGDGELSEDFHENHLVRVGDGRVLGRLPLTSRTGTGLAPLGDGTWLDHTAPGEVRRYRR